MNQPVKFIGREAELQQLADTYQLPIATLAVITGRRRIGKSRLIQEFAEQLSDTTYYEFSGLAPDDGITEQDQKNEFVRLFRAQTGFPIGESDDWGDLFTALAKLTENGRHIILFDEISWMAHDSPTCMPKLKSIWDSLFKKNSELMLVICGSVSSWIEKNILGSTGFFGRPSLHMSLSELPLYDCQAFWGDIGKQLSAYEKLKVLSLTGGVPRYLELIKASETPEANFLRLCFNPHGLLVKEFQKIFSDIYGKRSPIYLKIIRHLSECSSADQKTLSNKTGLAMNGNLTEYLSDLCLGGFICREHSWNFKSQSLTSLSHYRLTDCFCRFYLKYIEPNLHRIEQNLIDQNAISSMPGWDTMMGYQFESLVRNNTRLIVQLLKIPLGEIVFASPYFQRKTQRQEACQIDFLIQSKYSTVYVCEIKFKRKPIENNIINEVSEKIKKLKLPKNFSIRPVLIHVNGVDETSELQNYFSNIIDFADCFKHLRS